MSTFVVDASVVLKWFVDEEGAAQALSLKRHHLVAPDLLGTECASALWAKVRRGVLSEAEGLWIVSLLARTEVPLEPMRDLLEPAMAFSLALNHPIYDCIYLALAQDLGCDLVTADRRFCRKVDGVVSVRVHLLEEMPGL